MSADAVVGASDVGIEMAGASAAGAKGGEGSGRPGAAEGRGGAELHFRGGKYAS